MKQHQFYLGPGRPDMFKRGALVMPHPINRAWLLAQFDFAKRQGRNNGEGEDPLCFGWHAFPRRDFRKGLRA